MADIEPLEPAEAYARLGRIRFGDTDLDTVLGLIAELARRSLPGAAEVSVTLVRGAGATTAACTGDLARKLDEAQYEAGYGPCLDASAANTTYSVPRTTTETRWPQWAAQAASQGINSAVAIGLPIREAVSGALNLYATEPGAFPGDAVVVGQTFAGYAAVALANAHVYDVTAGLARQLQVAMASRAVIEQAKGIIMGEQRCTADEAFRILAAVSQDGNRKVREVAAALVARTASPPGS